MMRVIPGALRKSSVPWTAVKLQLHFEGADASTTFTDSSASARTATVNGDAQIDTAQFKFGNASGLFDGTGDYLTYTDHADLTFAGNEFNVECFFRASALPGNGVAATLLGKYSSTAANREWLLHLLGNATAAKLRFIAYNGGVAIIDITGTTNLATGTWYHASISRVGNAYTLRLNGTSEATASSATAISDTATVLGVGGSEAGVFPFTGWIDEARIVNGYGVRTANFTVPSSAYFDGAVLP